MANDDLAVGSARTTSAAEPTIYIMLVVVRQMCIGHGYCINKSVVGAEVSTHLGRFLAAAVTHIILTLRQHGDS